MPQTSTPQRPDPRRASHLGPFSWLVLGVVFAAIALALFCAKAHAAGQYTLPKPPVTCTVQHPDTDVCMVVYAGYLDFSTTPPQYVPLPKVAIRYGSRIATSGKLGFITFDMPKFHPLDVQAVAPPGYFKDQGMQVAVGDHGLTIPIILRKNSADPHHAADPLH